MNCLTTWIDRSSATLPRLAPRLAPRLVRRLVRRLTNSLTLVVALALAGAATTTALAQNNTSGAIHGRVAPGSLVTAEHVGMGFSRSITASTDGTYYLSALPPGTYKVTYTAGQGAPRTRDVEVAIGSGTQVDGSEIVLQLEEFRVGSLSINPVDFSNTTSVSIFTDKQLELLPVGRSTTEVALLAPGAVVGDTAFGNLPSIGGASVAENAYFINGFNISNFRNGLSPSLIPFEFYSQFEVNTAAYSAEFGRSTGGVINATSKSGSNQFHGGAGVYFWPDAGRANAPDVYYANTTGAIVPFAYNSRDYSESSQANVWASGPLWKNKLFFYALYQTRQTKDQDIISTGSRFNRDVSSDPFWSVKLDFIPFKNHHLEYTGFDNTRKTTTTQWAYNFAAKERAPVAPSSSFDEAGGRTHIGRYTGTFFDRLTLSALAGKGETTRATHSSLDGVSRVDDARAGSTIRLAGGPTLNVIDAKETRKALRFDAEYSFHLLGNHRLRVGQDQENNVTSQISRYGGGAAYIYERSTPGGTINGGTVPAGVTQVVRRSISNNSGSFKVNSTAWYAEDNWTTLQNRLVIRAGLRGESFENLDVKQKVFVAINDQLAPRLGAAYDLFGNQTTKVFANYGRYHLPVASNVNVSLAGAELLVREYFALTSVGADNQPVLGAPIGAPAITSAGIVRDRRELTDLDLKPMYQDEWVVGVQHALNKKIKLGLRGTARKFGYAIDDMIVNHALETWARANGYPGWTFTGSRAYVLGNAGRPISMFWDFNRNGTLDANEKATLTPQMLGYPAAERNYYSMEFTAEKVHDGKWAAQFSYTWAHSYGNYEGLVHSDSGQAQAGLSRLFDTPALTMNTYGDQPNDKRHQFKVLGSYVLTPEISLGTNLSLVSGRPLNRIGSFNDPVVGTGYGAYYHLVPRGSAGRTPWQFRQDLTLTYRPKWIAEKRLSVSATVFNVLNRLTPTEYAEFAQTNTGARELTYGLPSSWQSPRSLRLSARYEY